MELRKKILKFRPQGYYRNYSGKWKIKNNPVGKYNWQERSYNSKHYIRVGARLHYLADHAPMPLNKKWRLAFRKFCKLHPKF